MGLGIDIIIFVFAILFGIFLYWRESKHNGAYRFVNRMLNSKSLQMHAKSRKGFIYEQSFIPRLLFVVISLLVIGLILQFLTPIPIFSNYFALSGFATFATGTLIGTYLANAVIKTTEVVDSKSDTISDAVEEVVEKGKVFIDDLKRKQDSESESLNTTPKSNATSDVNKQSARDRLKDKGLM